MLIDFASNTTGKKYETKFCKHPNISQITLRLASSNCERGCCLDREIQSDGCIALDSSLILLR